MTAGANQYVFRVPYSEMLYGSQTIYITANSEAQAMERLRIRDWEYIEEGDYETEDSEPIHCDYHNASLKEVYCRSCESKIDWVEDRCECAEGWNDPDVTTPDVLYG